MKKESTKLPKWDMYESALLIEAYILCRDLPTKDKLSIQEKLSFNLRKIAENKGLLINDTYRNVVGIRLKMQAIDFLFTNKGKIVPNKVFIEVYEKYVNDKATFYKILSTAYKMIETNINMNTTKTNKNNLFTQENKLLRLKLKASKKY